MNGADDCRAYVEHLQHEHGHLNQLLLEIGHEVAALDKVGDRPDPIGHLARRLSDLRQQLQKHFAEEETGGCMEEAVTRCPTLRESSKGILVEHPQLDRMLEQLLEQARAAAAADVQRDFQVFANKLREHEQAENRLLQMAFGAEAADYDVEGDA
jgi:Hemerythrin HHE cation binding domain